MMDLSLGRQPASTSDRIPTSHRRIVLGLLLMVLLPSSVGCQSWMKNKKKEQWEKDLDRIQELLQDPDRPRLVGEVAVASGMVAHRFDSIGLVANLQGTGGSVRPSNQREMLMTDMRKHDINNPDEIIDSPTTAATKVRVFSYPGDEVGDMLDLTVELSDQCDATDLRDGYLMPTYLRQIELLNGKNYSSNDKARASGDLIILPESVSADGKINPLAGVVLSGGKLMETHLIGLRVRTDYRHVILVKAIQKSINQRFFFKDASKQKAIAVGRNDWRIDIEALPKYKLDPVHYMSTILALGFYESEEEVAERVDGCRVMLRNRETARQAACELEAVGTKAAAEVLLGGLLEDDLEIRFHSAYSLAYLDRPESVPVLKDIARFHAALRPLCLIGLAINECPDARLALDELLQEPLPELRYGAFWAIRQRNARDPVVTGEMIGAAFRFVQVPSQIPLVAVSLEKEKEVVLFGGNAVVQLTKELSPTPYLRMIPMGSGMVRIAKRHPAGDVLQNAVASDLVSILRGMAAIEANYNDVVQMLDMLGRTKQISIPVEMNPRPKGERAGQPTKNPPDSATSSEDANGAQEILTVDRSSRGPSKKTTWVDFPSWVKSVSTKRKKSPELEAMIQEAKASSPGSTISSSSTE